MKFEIDENENLSDLKAIEAGIANFNGSVLASSRRGLHITCKDPGGVVTAGLIGSTNWSWLYVRMLWVSESLRGQGVGRELMVAAEQEAKSRGCHGVWLDTFSFQARGFYEKLGYEVFGELQDFPQGHQRFYLSKKI